MNHKLIAYAGILTLLLMLFIAQSGGAQSPAPGTFAEISVDGSAPRYAADGLMTQTAVSDSGSDRFGYMWESGKAASWIDATSGTDTGMSGYSGGQYVGPVGLPFSFEFYENSYDKVWINGSYITFTAENADGYGPDGMDFPNNRRPNNVIASLWSTYELADSGDGNRIFYRSGGSAPNRYFVVEWHTVEMANQPRPGPAVFTHEIVLYENGDIKLQYKDLDISGGYWCDSVKSGMEDSRGLDGFNTTEWCEVPQANSATTIDRPPDAARLFLLQPYEGSFVSSHGNNDTVVSLINTGTFGTDTYNLTSSSSWPVAYFDRYNRELKDTNGDGVVDTGSIAQGEVFEFFARTTAPTIVNMGDKNKTAVTLTSMNDSSVSDKQTIDSVVPLPFAQTYTKFDNAVYLVKPYEQFDQKVFDFYAPEIAIAETPAKDFVYVGTQYGDTGGENSVSFSEITYTHLDADGAKRYPSKKLTDHNNATMDTYDNIVKADVAPDGTVGIIYQTRKYDEDFRSNSNIFFATINGSGTVTFGPQNLTNNDQFAYFRDEGVPSYGGTGIAATADNRFVLIWQANYYHSDTGDYQGPYMLQVRKTDGAAASPTNTLTGGVSPGNPGIGELSGNRAGIAVPVDGEADESEVLFYVVDSKGDTVSSVGDIGAGGRSGFRSGIDVAQFSNGNILIAWNNQEADESVFGEYTVLNNSYNRLFPPKLLTHPAMRAKPHSSIQVSLAPSEKNQIVAAWQDPDFYGSKSLYYAAIKSDGSFDTPPMIFATDEYGLHTGAAGYGNTTLTVDPTVAGVDTAIISKEDITVGQNQTAGMPIKFGNAGATTATEVVVTAKIADGLTYAGDDSGVQPSTPNSRFAQKMSKTYVWKFSERMDFLANGSFTLYVTSENAELDVPYPVTATIGTKEADGNIDNNEVTILVRFIPQKYVYLPAVLSN